MTVTIFGVVPGQQSALSIQCAKDGCPNEEFPGFAGMAERTSPNVSCLQRHTRVPKRRSLRIDRPDSKMCRFDRGQPSRRMGKRGNAEFQRFLGISTGSASELDYHFLMAHDLHLLDEADYERLNVRVVDIKRMLASLVRKVERG